MSLIAIVLVFIMAIVVTVFLSHLLPVKVPLPLIQIAAGAALAASGFQVDFDPHIFLLLFIPPLLFLDGWRIPKDAFFRDMKPILSLAIGLVMVTILGIGLFIHWLIPAITVAAGFALAAILSPTDPVAVSAMTASSPLPSRMAHILEGESLLNDASGLVAFNFAIAAVLTGSFSPGDAVVKFFLMAFGGILSGLVVVWVTGKCNNFLVRRTREEPAIQILISLLIPFAAYLLAEAFHVSGILAAVAAGIAMHYEQLSGPRGDAHEKQRGMVHAADHPQRDDLSDAGRATAAHAQDAAGGSQPGRRLFALVSAAVRRGHHPGAWSDALRLGMAVDEADNFSPQTSRQGHHRPSTIQYPRRHGAGGSEGLCDPRRYSDAAGGAGRWFAVPGP